MQRSGMVQKEKGRVALLLGTLGEAAPPAAGHR